MRGKLCKLKQSIVCFARALGSEKAFATGIKIMREKKRTLGETLLPQRKGPGDARMGNDVLVKAKAGRLSY